MVSNIDLVDNAANTLTLKVQAWSLDSDRKLKVQPMEWDRILGAVPPDPIVWDLLFEREIISLTFTITSPESFNLMVGFFVEQMWQNPPTTLTIGKGTSNPISRDVYGLDVRVISTQTDGGVFNMKCQARILVATVL